MKKGTIEAMGHFLSWSQARSYQKGGRWGDTQLSILLTDLLRDDMLSEMHLDVLQIV